MRITVLIESGAYPLVQGIWSASSIRRPALDRGRSRVDQYPFLPSLDQERIGLKPEDIRRNVVCVEVCFLFARLDIRRNAIRQQEKQPVTERCNVEVAEGEPIKSGRFAEDPVVAALALSKLL